LKKIFLILFFLSLSNIAFAGNCKGIYLDKSSGFAQEEWFEQWKK